MFDPGLLAHADIPDLVHICIFYIAEFMFAVFTDAGIILAVKVMVHLLRVASK